ncbi:extracellular solute-binding protein [Microlunatus panaciterrae]|uniref:Multiple sugar transport system substrate-binding protein n=1 Tax=Microlunatus panaciterrae TaxID=400768 RepID=A0ABS2RDZ1_9ACTN|nr:extracellular solute-binding protein [Microlunatus panaciterrae]MBM7797199.1 multiple sugar transport system substrate-binding protein [Microlunatus panaciterrae]
MSEAVPATISRRNLLLGGAALAGGALTAGALAGCSTTAAGAETMQYWHLMSGGDGIVMGDMVKAINARHLGFQTQQTVLAWGPPYYTKLAMASVGGRAPDVAIMHATRVAGYAPGGLLDVWDQDLLAEVGITQDKFPERIWKKGFTDDKLYAVALDSHPFIFMYNTDVADKAGLLGSNGQLRPISSPDELYEAGRKMAEATGVHGFSYGFLGDGAQMWRMFYTFYRQQNADFVLTQGSKAQVDMDAAVKALEVMRTILDGKIAAKSGDYGTAVAEFAGGHSGALFTGVWETPTMITAKLPFDAMTIPTIFDTPAAYADSHTFVLPHQSTPGQTRKDAYKFVAAMLKSSLKWAGAGHIPAFSPIVDSAEYKKLVPQSHYANAADIINYDPVAWFTGSGSNFQNYFAENIQNVLLGQVEPKVGMEGFIARINSLLAQPNPV